MNEFLIPGPFNVAGVVGAMKSFTPFSESRNTLKALVLRRNTAGSSWVPIAPLSRSPPTRPTVVI
jgi:hypothetical protein